jgi:hypothetical protein
MAMFKRRGARKEKFAFTVHIHSLHIKLPDNTLTKIVVKRGSKSEESSPGRIFSQEAVYEYVLEAVTSLYFKQDSFLKKSLQVILYNLETHKPTKAGLVEVNDI